MRTYDFSPLFRSTVGFDPLFDLLDQTQRVEPAWPPYNIEKVNDDQYCITMAVAGFGPEEIELTQNGTSLLVSGERKDSEGERQYTHRGIAARSFRQTFNLAEHVKVTNANLDKGLLTIEMVREVPEALKPRRIQIGETQDQKVQQNNERISIEKGGKAA